MQVGQSLVASGFFAHVTNDHNLEDAKLYYRLQVCACDVIVVRHGVRLIVAVRQKSNNVAIASCMFGSCCPMSSVMLLSWHCAM